MSTSIILLDQNFNANYVDIMVFEPSVLFPPATVWGVGDRWGARQFVHTTFRTHDISYKNQNQTFRTKAKPDISYKKETGHFAQK